jgi:hypothetical protein
MFKLKEDCRPILERTAAIDRRIAALDAEFVAMPVAPRRRGDGRPFPVSAL